MTDSIAAATIRRLQAAVKASRHVNALQSRQAVLQGQHKTPRADSRQVHTIYLYMLYI